MNNIVQDPKVGRKINNENLKFGKPGNEKFKNLNKNPRDKPHQPKIKDGKENLRHGIHH